MLTLTGRSLRRKILITDSDTSQCSVLGLSQLVFFRLLNLWGLAAAAGHSDRRDFDLGRDLSRYLTAGPVQWHTRVHAGRRGTVPPA